MTRELAGLATGLWRPPGAELGLPGYASDVWAYHPSTAQGRIEEHSGRGCCASHQVIERSGPSWVLQFWSLARVLRCPLYVDTKLYACGNTFVPVHRHPGCEVCRIRTMEIVEIRSTNPNAADVVPHGLIIDLRVCVCAQASAGLQS